MNELLLTLPPGEQQVAGRVLGRCPRADIAARATLRASDLPEAKLLVVERGVVLLKATRPGLRRPLVLAVAGSGVVIAPPLPNESLVGLTDARVRVIPRAHYETLLALPGLANALVESLLESLHEREESLANVSLGLHSERLRRKLFQLARSHGKVGPEGIEIELPLTHQLLAQMIGSTRETVTSSIAAFSREGVLVRNGRGYRLTVSPEVLG